MKQRSVFFGFLAVLVAFFLIAGPLGHNAPAQQRSQSTPPLRNLVTEYDPVVMPESTAYAIFTTEEDFPHQVWYRVSGGDALFRQRMHVYQENASPRPINQLPPSSELVQEIITNQPTDWFVLPVESSIFTYYFAGDHRVTPNSSWENGHGVAVTRTRYGNGNLYVLSFEDYVELDDYNDIIVEVAILYL